MRRDPKESSSFLGLSFDRKPLSHELGGGGPTPVVQKPRARTPQKKRPREGPAGCPGGFSFLLTSPCLTNLICVRALVTHKYFHKHAMEEGAHVHRLRNGHESSQPFIATIYTIVMSCVHPMDTCQILVGEKFGTFSQIEIRETQSSLAVFWYSTRLFASRRLTKRPLDAVHGVH